MKGTKIKYEEQELKLIDSLIMNNKKLREIMSEAFKLFPNRSSDSIFHIVRKRKIQLKEKNMIPKKSVYFYTDEQIKILTNAINTGEPLLRIARRFHEEFGRTENNLYVKLQKINDKIGNKEVKPKLKPTAAAIKKDIVQSPVDIGVEVPHGMTFEGKPKKIMLHSDHFRIYF